MSEVIWSPQERQRLVITCPYDEILYGGAAGGGKTDCLIGDWLAHSERYGKDARGVLFRNSFPELMEIQRRMEIIFGAIGSKFKEKDMTWTFQSGATLRLSYLDSFDDALKHRGHEYTWRGHDELTMRPTDEEYVFLESRMRSSAGVPCRTISTSNPGGPGHSWVMKRFKIDHYPKGMTPIHDYFDVKRGFIMERGEASIWDEWDSKDLPPDIRRKTRIFIPGRLADNKYLDTDGMYRSKLLGMPEAQRKMLLEGRWDVVEGAFFDEWNPVCHVVSARSVRIGKDWKKIMGMDWGTTSPYAVVWMAQHPHGHWYVYRELYGCKPDKPNEGLREAPSVVAERILALEEDNDEYISERYLDASCFDNKEMGTSVSEQFRQNGLFFQPSQKKFKSGSIALFRDWLKVVNGVSRIQFFDTCVNLIRTIPALQINRHNVEQYDTDGEDHLCLSGDTKIVTKDGLKRIESLDKPFEAWTPIGWRWSYAIKTGQKRCKSVKLSNGEQLTLTDDHPILTYNGFLPLTRLCIGDTLVYGGYHDRCGHSLREDPIISWEELLSLRELLPEQREETSPGGMDSPQWGDPEGVCCTPCRREQGEQPSLKSGIAHFFKSYAPSYDSREKRMVQTEYQEGYCQGPGVAPLRRGAGVAQEPCENDGIQGMFQNAYKNSHMLPMSGNIHDQAGRVLLLGGMQDTELDKGFDGIRIEAIEDAGVMDVYGFYTEEAHCALTGAGVFVSNCDALIYAIRRNIKTRDELNQSRGVVERNRRIIKRYGAYGAQ